MKKEKPMFNKDFLEGEKSFAKAVLRRIKNGNSIGHIELLCQATADELKPISQPKQEDWEKEFREFGRKYYWDWCGNPEPLINFIDNLLAKEREEVLSEVERNVKDLYKDTKWDNNNPKTWGIDEIEGNNDAITNVLEIINRLK